MLANVSDQSEVSSSAPVDTVPPAQWRSDSESDEASTPEQAQISASPQSGNSTHQAQQRIISAAAVSQSLSSPVQPNGSKGNALGTSGRETKEQTHSVPAASQAAARAAITLPSALAASQLPPAPLQWTAQAESKPASSAGTSTAGISIEGNAKAPLESTGANPAQASIPSDNQDKLTVTGGTTGDTGATKTSAMQQPLSAEASTKTASTQQPLDAGASTKTSAMQQPVSAGASTKTASVQQPLGAGASTKAASAQQPLSAGASTKTGPVQQPLSANASSPDATEPAPARGITGTDAVQSTISLSAVPGWSTTDTIQLPDGTSQVTGSSNTMQPRPPSGVSAAGDAKDRTSQAATGASGTPAQNSAVNNQTVQRPDANLSQQDPGAPKSADPTSPQIQTVALQGASHTVGAPSDRADSAPQLSHEGQPAAAVRLPEVPETSVVNTAGVIQKMSGTEMRVAVNSTEFGAVSIRTSFSEQQVNTQITVDHGDLSRVLSAHIPAVEARLGSDLGMRAVVQVSQTASSFSGGGGNSPQGGQRNFGAAPASTEIAAVLAESEDPYLHLAATTLNNDRLDIQA